MDDDEELSKEELIKELDGRYQSKQNPAIPSKKSTSTKLLGIGLIILVAFGFLLTTDIDEFEGIQDLVFGKEEVPPEIIEPLEPAKLELYKFSDLTSNATVNVEIWLINIGEDTAMDIEIYIRARNQDGMILLSDEISPTVLILRDNETCSAVYSVSIEPTDTTIMHTIEIEWVDGRTSYSKTTTI